jgi:hypothetical protein
MKSASISWAMSAVLAICLTPGLSSFAPRNSATDPTALAQADGAVAVPGSADTQGPGGGDDDYQAGQAQAPDDSDATEQPPANMQQPNADDSGDDSSAQNGDDTSAQQQSADDADQGATPAKPQSGDDDN